MLLRWFSVVTCCAVSVFYASAQIQNPQMEAISVAQGLSSNHATVLCQDRQGFVWMGTLGGLNRYDGHNLKIFRSLPGDSTSLLSNIITALHEDRYGVLWVGTTMGLSRFNPADETFISYASKPGDPQSLGYNMVNFVSDDRDGQLWIGTSGGGLNLLDRETRTFSRYYPPGAAPDFLERTVVTEFCQDRQREHLLWVPVWVGNVPALYSFDTQTKTFTRFDMDSNWRGGEIHSVVEDRSGQLWLATEQGVAVFDKTARTFRRFDQDPKAPKGLVINCKEDRQGQMWVCGFGSGLHRYDPAQGRFEQYAHDPLDPNSLSSNQVHSIFEDRSGVRWIATDGGGVNRWRPDQQRFQSLQTDPANPRYTTGGIVTALCEDRSGRVWIGSSWKGLDCYNRRTGRFEPIDFKSGDLRKKAMAIYSLLEDRSGHIWMGSNGRGLFCLDPMQRTFVQYLPDPANPASLGGDEIRTMCEDRAGHIWLGTFDGLDRFDPATGQFAHYRHDPAQPASLPSNAVHVLLEDHSRNLWVGTEHGLSRMEGNTGRFRHFLNEENLQGRRVHNIAEDRAGNIWAGTDRGLYRLSFAGGADREPQVGHYSEANGLPSNSINGILEDGRGRLWISTSKGLNVFKNPQHSAADPPDFQYYTMRDGLIGFFEDKSCFKNPRGEMFFGGENGYNVFHPDSIRNNPHPPPVVITNFEKFDADRPEAGPVSLRGIAARSEVVLSYKNNIFTIAFAALDFRDPGKNRYAYQLEGFSKAWVQLGGQHQVTFTNLDPGTYIFRVKGSNDDGIWCDHPAELRIVITPPWWETWWAYTAYLALILSGIFGFIRFRTRYLEGLNRELEQAVQSATSRISDQNRQLALQAESLRALDQLKSRFFANVSHELRTPLTLMLGPISSLLKNKNLDSQGLKLLQIAQQNGQRLLSLIGQILDLGKLEAGKLALDEAPVCLAPLFLRLAGNFDSHAKRLDIRYAVGCEPPADLTVLLDQRKFEVVLNNLLSNAFKFTPAGGEIEVRLESQRQLPENLELSGSSSAFQLPTSNLFLLSVRDTGRGIHPDDLPHIFERYFQSKQPNAPSEGGTGIGLALCSEYAKLFEGRVWAESEPGRGSVFFFEFPKKDVFAENEVLAEAEPADRGAAVPVAAIAPHLLLREMPPTSARPKPRILVVEDNEHLQIFLKAILSAEYEVTVAGNGAEALRLMSDKLGFMGGGTATIHHPSLITPDLVLSDIMMPVMDGFQLLELLKGDDRYRHIPVVMLTALADLKDKLRALRIGVDDYLLKPFEEEELLVRLRNLLRNARERFLPEKTGATAPEVAEPPARQVSADDLAWLEALEQTVLRQMPNFNLSADMLSDELAMSRPSFFRRVKHLTGLTVQQYVAEARFRTARAGLEQRRFSTVKAAALSVGLRDVEHFAQQFRDRFGRVPSEYL